MIKTGVWAGSAMCVTLLAMTVVSVACNDNKPAVVGGGGGPHTLSSGKGRKCPGGPPQHYEIEIVDNSQVLNDPADDALVVCEGDMVSWFIGSDKGVIDITITDSYPDELFGKGHSKFKSNPGSPKSETGTQTVQPQVRPGHDFKYTILVTDKAGTFHIDPHVIPMGN
jgi:hypothetical protein